MDFNPIIFSVPLFFFLIGIELLINYFKKAEKYRLNDSISNINAGTSQQTFGIFLKIFIPLTMYELVYHNFHIWTIPNTWWSFILLFFLYDLCYYWAHRMSHEINIFWAGHVVHHQSEEYNLSVALRQSWFQAVYTFPFYLPLALLGFDTNLLIWVGAINLTYQFWIHTEMIDKMGFLEWFLNTPSHHRVHHGRNPKYIDKNHAGVFIIWDRMFGTFQAEEERPTYGITIPLKSWNPVWANFSHYQTIIRQVQKTPRFMDKIKVLFKKPGWQPASLGGPVAAPEVDKSTYQKFDTDFTWSLGAYALFQYVLITVGALFYFLSEAQMPTLWRIVGAGLIVWAVFQNSAVFTPKPYVYILEFLRPVITLGFISYTLYEHKTFEIFLYISLTILAVNFLWLWVLRKVFLN